MRLLKVHIFNEEEGNNDGESAKNKTKRMISGDGVYKIDLMIENV